jgi:hypothetical protein
VREGPDTFPLLFPATAVMTRFLRWFNVMAKNNPRLQNFTLVGMDSETQLNNIATSASPVYALGEKQRFP